VWVRVSTVLVYNLLIIGPEGIEVGELSLHELLYNLLVHQNERLFGEVVLRVLQQFSESDA